MRAKLLVVGGEAKAAEINLRLPTIIGRGREATLALPHPLVSRMHCEIYEADGALRVRDLDSLNGTYVADQRINDAALPPGELLTVGTVTFRAVYGEEADFEDEETLPPAVERPAADATLGHAAETIPKPEAPSQPESPEQRAGVTSDTAWQPSSHDDLEAAPDNDGFDSFLNE